MFKMIEELLRIACSFLLQLELHNV